MLKFWENLRNKYGTCQCTILDKYAETSAGIKMPALQVVFSPYRYFVDNLGAFGKMAAVYSALMTVISLIFGFSFLCILVRQNGSNLYCSSSSLMYLFYVLLRFVILAMFVVQYQKVIAGSPFSFKSLFQFGRKELKTLSTILAFISLFAFPLISTYILMARVPNPDWRIETAFFGVVSLGYLVPVFAVRLYSVVSFVALGEPVPPLKCIWERSQGNMLKIFFSVFVMLIFFVLIVINMMGGFRSVELTHILYFSSASEFIYNLIFLMFVSWLVGLCYIQKNILFGAPVNE